MILKKNSDEVLKLRIQTYKANMLKEDFIDSMNVHKFYDKYDLGNFRKDEMELRALCNFVIHSFVFAPTIVEGKGLTGILINSDNTQQNIFGVSIYNIASAFHNVASDDIGISVFRRNHGVDGRPVKGKYARKARSENCESLKKYTRVDIFE